MTGQKKRDEKIGIILVIITALGLIVYVSGNGAYTRMVKLQEEVRSQWSNVEDQYQCQADLIPNLVNTVDAHAPFEQPLLDSVMEAYGKAAQITLH